MQLARLLVVSVIALATPALAHAAPNVAKLAQSRVDAAAKVYASVLPQWKAGTVTLDVVYDWSVRWVTAAVDAAAAGKAVPAFADHLARMVELEKAVAERVQAGLARPVDADAAAYYRVEAELWQARAKSL